MTQRLALLVALLSACSGDKTEASGSCDLNRVEIPFDEVSPLGLSPSELLADVGMHPQLVVVRMDGTRTTAHVGLQASGPSHYVTGGACNGPEGVQDLQVPVKMVFRTDDGWLEQTSEALLHDYGEPNGRFLRSEIDPSRVQGSLVVPKLAPSEEWRFWIEGYYYPRGFSGVISFEALAPSPTGEQTIVMAWLCEDPQDTSCTGDP